VYEQEHGVDINEVVSPEEIGGGCALHVAAFLDSANATHELLLLGADILKVDSMGRNALDIAKERPTSPVLHILLEHQSTFHA
jgi:ankyrin repeat protein